MGGQGGCERRIEVFVKIQKKKINYHYFFFFLGGGGGWSGVGLGGIRVDVNEELKFGKIHKKNQRGVGRGVRGASGWRGSGWM